MNREELLTSQLQLQKTFQECEKEIGKYKKKSLEVSFSDVIFYFSSFRLFTFLELLA